MRPKDRDDIDDLPRRWARFAFYLSIISTSLSVVAVAVSVSSNLFKYASRVELPELPPEAYLPYIERCMERFKNPNSVVRDIQRDHPPIKVVYQGDLSFLLTWRGRSGTLSLHDDNFVEDVKLQMRIVRNFRSPQLVEADIVTADARQAPWPSNAQFPSDAVFKPFDDAQQRSLALYSNYLASYITTCTREEVTAR